MIEDGEEKTWNTGREEWRTYLNDSIESHENDSPMAINMVAKLSWNFPSMTRINFKR